MNKKEASLIKVQEQLPQSSSKDKGLGDSKNQISFNYQESIQTGLKSPHPEESPGLTLGQITGKDINIDLADPTTKS